MQIQNIVSTTQNYMLQATEPLITELQTIVFKIIPYTMVLRTINRNMSNLRV